MYGEREITPYAINLTLYDYMLLVPECLLTVEICNYRKYYCFIAFMYSTEYKYELNEYYNC